jgi:uncharacterized protein (TIGR02646 family)
MRKVHKGTEPPTLTEHRLDTVIFPDWPNYRGKQQAREYTLREQREICAFCQGRLIARQGRMKLAHVVPIHGHAEGENWQLKWSNIVGACMGGADTGRPQIRHCDTLQENTPLLPALDPVQFVNGSLTYEWDGPIKSRDQSVQKQLNDVLGLNCKPVIRSRLQALEQLEEHLAQVDDREAERQHLLQLLDSERHGDQVLHAYADFLLFHLREGRLSV